MRRALRHSDRAYLQSTNRTLFLGSPGAGERTRDLLIKFTFSFHHFTAETQRHPQLLKLCTISQLMAALVSSLIQAFFSRQKVPQSFLVLTRQGCQIFLDTLYQNGENIYQIITKLSNDHKINLALAAIYSKWA
jgi:hypothetical protein